MWCTFVPNTISNIHIGMDNEIYKDDEEEKFQVNSFSAYLMVAF